MTKWFLLMTLQVWPPCGGIDCGINPGYRPTNHEVRVTMPSIDVCRQVRAANPGSRCLTEDLDK